MNEFLNAAIDLCTNAGGKIILAVIVFIVGRIVIKKITQLVARNKSLSALEPTVHTFATNAVSILLNVLLILSIISILGIPIASVVAVLATCAVAVGMSLQGALSNLAGGIMLMIFRPFNVGDYVSTSGEEGVVKEIALFYTILTTVDNRRVIIPNGALMNANVTNFSAEATRRVDLVFSCGKDEDAAKVMNILTDVMNSADKVLKDPAPFAGITGGTNEATEFTARAWCKTADYWDVYFALTSAACAALGAAGIKAPAVRIVQDK